MLLEDAFDIVYELAEQNALSTKETQGDPELEEEARRQRVALAVVHDYLINHIYE